MRILVFFSVLDRLLARVAAELHRRQPEWRFAGVTLGRLGTKYVRQSADLEWQPLASCTDYHRANARGQYDLTRLRMIEDRYGVPNLYLIASADNCVRNYPRNQMLEALQLAFDFAEKIMDEAQPDCIIAEGIDCISSYAFFSIAHQRGIPYLHPAANRIAGRTTIVDNPFDRWPRTEALYESYRRNGLPEDARLRAEQFLAGFRRTMPRPATYFEPPMPAFRGRDVAVLFKLLRARLDDPADRYLASPLSAVWVRASRIFRKKCADRFAFQRSDVDDDFVLYPLHLEPEAAMYVRAPHVTDQIALADAISRSIPVGCWLYVKEHKWMVGRRPLSEYRRLLRMPNVKLISPYENSHDLIRQARLVAVVSGTMGWEALLYGKPVISFGNAFYNGCDQVARVRDLGQLPAVIRERITRHEMDEVSILCFLAAVLETSHPGDIVHPDDAPAALEPENVGKVADAFHAEIQERLGSGAFWKATIDSSK